MDYKHIYIYITYNIIVVFCYVSFLGLPATSVPSCSSEDVTHFASIAQKSNHSPHPVSIPFAYCLETRDSD